MVKFCNRNKNVLLGLRTEMEVHRWSYGSQGAFQQEVATKLKSYSVGGWEMTQKIRMHS